MSSVIIRFQGGLGNQLFQYAAGRSLASKLGARLLYDDTLLNRRRWRVTPRRYELDNYTLPMRKLTSMEVASVRLRVQRPFCYLYDLGLKSSPVTYFKERQFEYDSMLLEQSGDVIVEGYWQSERYFADIADELRHELQPNQLPSIDAQKLLDRIAQGESISIHVRRGDYVSNVITAQSHHVCDLNYYRRAAAFLADRVANPVFFVFTDDPVWVRIQFGIDFPTMVVSMENGWPAFEELRLMSHCTHHIIANSSFSWWGAWLKHSSRKIVVAPKAWFHKKVETKDLLPRTWTRL